VRGAKSGALRANSTEIDPKLATIINAWPMLPEAIRAGIVAMVKASAATTGSKPSQDSHTQKSNVGSA